MGLILQNFTFASGQDINAAVTIDEKTAKVHISGELGSGFARGFRRNIGFVVPEGDPDAVYGLRAKGSNGDEIALTRLRPTEWVAAADIEKWSYSKQLSIANGMSAGRSRIGKTNGILFFEDLMPIFGPADIAVSSRINIDLPENWELFSNASYKGGILEINDLRSAVAIVGSDWEKRRIDDVRGNFYMVRSGTWRFSSDEAARSAKEIYQSYSELFGRPAGDNALLVLAARSGYPGSEEWEAEVRGLTAIIVSSDPATGTRSLQRFHEQLRHELFHFWIPNAVNLRGNYAWFYEGFALYQSLRTALALNRISFNDFLETISKAYAIDRAVVDRKPLVDISMDRRSRHSAELYARGLMVAFLTDVAMLERSGGKRSVETLIRDIFLSHSGKAGSADGNEAVLLAMKGRSELSLIARDLVEGSRRPNLSGPMRAAGIVADEGSSFAKLAVADKTTRKQRVILDKLGYNNWSRAKKYQNEN